MQINHCSSLVVVPTGKKKVHRHSFIKVYILSKLYIKMWMNSQSNRKTDILIVISDECFYLYSCLEMLDVAVSLFLLIP